jgi:hypothetical protein
MGRDRVGDAAGDGNAPCSMMYSSFSKGASVIALRSSSRCSSVNFSNAATCSYHVHAHMHVHVHATDSFHMCYIHVLSPSWTWTWTWTCTFVLPRMISSRHQPPQTTTS